MPCLVFLARIRQVELSMKMICMFECAILCNLTNPTRKTGIWILATLAGTSQVTYIALGNVVQIAPHWSGVEDVVRDMEKSVDGQNTGGKAIWLVLIIVSAEN